MFDIGWLYFHWLRSKWAFSLKRLKEINAMCHVYYLKNEFMKLKGFYLFWIMLGTKSGKSERKAICVNPCTLFPLWHSLLVFSLVFFSVSLSWELLEVYLLGYGWREELCGIFAILCKGCLERQRHQDEQRYFRPRPHSRRRDDGNSIKGLVAAVAAQVSIHVPYYPSSFVLLN